MLNLIKLRNRYELVDHDKFVVCSILITNSEENCRKVGIYSFVVFVLCLFWEVALHEYWFIRNIINNYLIVLLQNGSILNP